MTIDQSVRIEETNRDTIIGIADKKKKFTLKLTSKIKKKLQSHFRKIKKPRVFPMIVFAAAAYLAVKKSKFNPGVLVIDIEYPGHEPAIKNIVLRSYRIDKRKEPDIYFSKIGKKDPAHNAAIEVHRGKAKCDYSATETEMMILIKRK